MAQRTQTEIDAAITKRRRRSLQQAEQENLLAIGKRKPKKEPNAAGSRKPQPAKRYTEAANFSIPTPMVPRPRAADGSSSFHFSYTPVSKSSVPTVNGRPLDGRWNAAGALAHSKYIERDGAAETVAGHDAYIERSNAIEAVDESIFQEAHLGQPDSNELLFTNISDDPFLRQEYWRAVERCEREPKENYLTFSHASSPDWWPALADRTDAPLALTDHIAHASAAPSGDRQHIRSADLPVTAELAGAILEWARNVRGWSHDDPPIGFKSGRGGRVQNRIVAELPHELDAAGRAEIVTRFAAKLADRGAMYTAVVHAPDAHNDRRNYHLHLIVHDRPAKWLAARNMWDFEVSESRRDKKRNVRVSYPLRQNKIAEFAQDKGPGASINFVATLRREFAEISNDVLAASGLTKRYDHRTYEKMGIDRIPTEHLGPKAAALESIGVPTAVGTLNAIKLWTAAERQIDRARSLAIEDIRATAVTKSADFKGDAARRRTLSIEISKRTAAAVRAAEIQHGLDLLALLEAKAKSRAVKTRDTSLTHLVDIEAGRADRTTTKNRSYIRKRFGEAQAHIAELETAFNADLPLIVAMRLDQQAEIAKIAQADKAIQQVHTDAAVAASKPSRVVETVAAETSARPATRSITSPTVRVPDPASTTASEQTATGPTVQPVVTPEPVTALPVTTTAQASVEASKPVTTVQPTPTGTVVPTPVPPLSPTPKAGVTEHAVQGPGQPPRRTYAQQFAQRYGLANLAGEHAARNRTGVLGLSHFGLVYTTRKSTDGYRFIGPEKTVPDVLLPAAAHDGVEHKPHPDHGMHDTGTGAPGAGNSGRSSGTSVTVPIDPQPAFESISNEPVAVAPPKPPPRADTDARWDAIITLIIKDSLYIVEIPTTDGIPKFDAPSLSRSDRALLSADRYSSRTAVRLKERFKHQGLEIGRVVRWLGTIEKDNATYPTIDGNLSIVKAPAHIQTLIMRYRTDPAIGAARDALIAKRKERAGPGLANPTTLKQKRPANRNFADQEPTGTIEELLSAGLEDRRREARDLYPETKVAQTTEVRAFLNALRDCSATEKIETAADRVARSPEAAEDVMRYGPDLATAYHRFAADTIAREPIKERYRRQDFGRER